MDCRQLHSSWCNMEMQLWLHGVGACKQCSRCTEGEPPGLPSAHSHAPLPDLPPLRRATSRLPLSCTLKPNFNSCLGHTELPLPVPYSATAPSVSTSTFTAPGCTGFYTCQWGSNENSMIASYFPCAQGTLFSAATARYEKGNLQTNSSSSPGFLWMSTSSIALSPITCCQFVGTAWLAPVTTHLVVQGVEAGMWDVTACLQRAQAPAVWLTLFWVRAAGVSGPAMCSAPL